MIFQYVESPVCLAWKLHFYIFALYLWLFFSVTDEEEHSDNTADLVPEEGLPDHCQLTHGEGPRHRPRRAEIAALLFKGSGKVASTMESN